MVGPRSARMASSVAFFCCNMGQRILAARSVCGKARGLLTSRAMRERPSIGSRAAAAAFVVVAGLAAAVAGAGGCSKKGQGADGGGGRVVPLGLTSKPPELRAPPARGALVAVALLDANGVACR